MTVVADWNNKANVAAVVERYPPSIRCSISSMEYLGNGGGFSGSEFWRWECAGVMLGLRRWPKEHPNESALSGIHRALELCRGKTPAVPVPLATIDGATYVRQAGHLWEVTPWLPGRADFLERPEPKRLERAMIALASFHNNTRGQLKPATSPGIQSRMTTLENWRSSGVDELRRAVLRGSSCGRQRGLVDLTMLASEAIEHFVAVSVRVGATLRRCANIEVPVQVAIRDIWSDHVLFQGDEVSGIIDFGAMRVDSVATDVARLLRSLARTSCELWNVGLRAYETVRRLSPDEQELVMAFDQSQMAMSALQWFQWLMLENRQFEDWDRIGVRINEAMSLLRHLRFPSSTLEGR